MPNLANKVAEYAQWSELEIIAKQESQRTEMPLSLSINGKLMYTCIKSANSNTIEMLSQVHDPFEGQNKENIFPLPFLHSSNKFALNPLNRNK